MAAAAAAAAAGSGHHSHGSKFRPETAGICATTTAAAADTGAEA